jgi:type VI secretion system protein ImpH
MAAENGRQGPGLSEHLLREPYRFNFFQAVRLLERWQRERAGPGGAEPRQPVGRDKLPDQEVVRFRAQPALSFPAGAVSQVRQPPRRETPANGETPPLELAVSFLGLTGPSGVLPYHYTSLLVRRLRDKDQSLRDWLDLFNHRLISLFYRAWEKYRLPFAYERSRLDGAGDPDPITRALYCLVGLGTGGLRDRLDIDDEAFLFYAGHFAHAPNSAVCLEGLLADYFEMPIRVEQAQGQWLCLDVDDRSLMPGPGLPKGRNCQLGLNLTVGERVWDVQSKFRLRIGPLTYAQFRRLMPKGDGLRPLCQLTRTYVGLEFDFDVQLILEGEEVPWCRLSGDGADPPYLGLNTWVRCQAFSRPVADAVFFINDL